MKIKSKTVTYSMSELNIQILASGSKGNASIVSDGETSLMLDCGLDINKLRVKSEFGITKLAGLLLSHEHGDHSKGLESVIKAGVDAYMLPQTAKNLKLNGHRVKHIKLIQSRRIGTFKVMAFPMVHDVPNAGFIINSDNGEKLIYLVDTAYCKYKFSGVNYIMLGISYDPEIAKKAQHPAKYKRVIQNHMSIKTAVDFIKANKSPSLKKIYLLHLSDSGSNEHRFKEEIQRASGVPVIVS